MTEKQQRKTKNNRRIHMSIYQLIYSQHDMRRNDRDSESEEDSIKRVLY